MPMSNPSRPPRPLSKAIHVTLDVARHEALKTLGRMTGRTTQSLLREGLDFVLARYAPVEIKPPRGAAGPRYGVERRKTPRVPTLTDPVDSPAVAAAIAVRAAFVAELLAPDDPATGARIQSAVDAAARHGFVASRARPKNAKAPKRSAGPRR